MPLPELLVYKPEREEPADFDAFWANTLADARSHPIGAQFEPIDAGLATIDVSDVTFAGFAGQPIKGWFLTPRDVAASPFMRDGRLPCVGEYIGYGGGRGRPLDWLMAPSAGHAHLVMDGRGQGKHVAGRRHSGPGVRGGNRPSPRLRHARHRGPGDVLLPPPHHRRGSRRGCLLYTSDAADE